MVTLRTRAYNTVNDRSTTLARLSLLVESEEDDDPTNPMMGDTTIETNKAWVGKIDNTTGTFRLIETNSHILPIRYIEGNFFSVFIHGQVIENGSQSNVDVKYKLGWSGFMIFAIVYSFPLILAAKFINQRDWQSIVSLDLWLLFFVVPPTLLIIVQLNRLHRKVGELLGVRHTVNV